MSKPRTRVRPVVRDSPLTNARPIVVERRKLADVHAAAHAPVTHSYAALGFYLGGDARVELNGAWKLGRGDVLLVPAGEPHRMIETRSPEYWGLAFCVPCFAAEASSALLEPFERVREGAGAVVHIPKERHEFLESLFRELEEAGREDRVGGGLDAVQTSLLTLILAEVERASRAAPPIRAGQSGVVAESLRFIERNCLRSLTLREVAAAVGKSPAYVTTALTRATGRSAVEWIVSGRMAEARRLLLHSDEMVDVIAERVGYADATHFIRMFRRQHGVTPAAWRAAPRSK
jgi:AraC-like DNA-binding protein